MPLLRHSCPLSSVQGPLRSVAPGEVIKRPGAEFADVIIEWMKDCEPAHGARTLGEAISIATAEGIIAAEEKSPEKYKEARRKLLTWCEAAGVALPRREMAALQFKDRVAAVTGPKNVAPIPAAPASDIGIRGGPSAARPGLRSTTAPVIVNDADHLRAIDEGRA